MFPDKNFQTAFLNKPKDIRNPMNQSPGQEFVKMLYILSTVKSYWYSTVDRHFYYF